MQTMRKITYLYFGDNLFHKLEKFVDQNSHSCVISQKCKMFSSVSSPSSCTLIDDVFLGWSYIIYRAGNTYNYVGFSNSKDRSSELFSEYCHSDLNIICGACKVLAAACDGKFYSYSTQNSKEICFTNKDNEQKVKMLATTDFQFVVLMDDGSVFTSKLSEECSLSPFHLQCPIVQVACGKEHNLFLSNTGQVFSYGCGSRGQLGHGTIENQDEPLLLEALDGIQIKSIACGGWHSAAVGDTGDLYIWGWNESGQLGFPCAELHSKDLPLSEIETVCCLPKIVELDDEKQIALVSCGSRHTVIMTDDFEVWSWGWNGYGQLGKDNCELCDKPSKMSLPSNFVPKNVKCAFWSTLICGIFPE